jgi:uncharacterized Zn-binding protein involved in type VI secretion
MPAAIVITSASTVDPCGAPPRVPEASSGDVYAEGKLVVRKDDAYKKHSCPGSPPHKAKATGSSGTVYANGKLIHRENDAISCGSKGANGASSVIIG